MRTFVNILVCGLMVFSLCLPVSAEIVLLGNAVGSEGAIQEQTEGNTEVVRDIDTEKKLIDEFKKILSSQLKKEAALKKRYKNASRHSVSKAVQKPGPHKKGSALIIVFEGTGAFNPHMAPMMMTAYNTLKDRIAKGVQSKLYRCASIAYKDLTGVDSKWSGLQAGLFPALFENPHLLNGNFDWLSFPSEEAEVLAGLDSINAANLKRILLDMKRSYASTPLGISNAVSSVKNYLYRAKSMGYTPKLIVLTHSSGGRSAVKFLEHLKHCYNPCTGKKKISADLVITIDPVVEAHEAMKEVIKQKRGEIGKDFVNNYVPFVKVKPQPTITIWSTYKPGILYKTSNTLRHINVYQTKDTEGIKMTPKFGIHGSKFKGADINQWVDDDSHGEVCYHDTTLKLFVSELEKLSE